jgi:receptor protein-tyrosine kinase/non-specific protein-tyrosine kinase
MWFRAGAGTTNRNLVSLFDPTSFEAEQYRRLRRRVEELGRTRGLQVLAVTSAAAGDGKTLTAINLAASLAQRNGAKILIIDADLRHPTVAKRLTLECTTGGFDAAVHEQGKPLQGFVQPVASGLSVLPCETSLEQPYELLTSSRLADLFTEARQLYDYVIVDTPPIIPVEDSALIRRSVDGYLVVVSANSTPRQLVAEALKRLDPDSIAGMVFNRDDRPLFGYYGSYYQDYVRSYARSTKHQR